MSQFKSYDEMTDGERRAIVYAASDAWENYNLSNPTDVGNMSNGTRFLREAMRAVRKPKVKHYETEWREPKSGERFFCQSGDVLVAPKYEARTEPNIISFDGGLDKPRAVVVREWEV